MFVFDPCLGLSTHAPDLCLQMAARAQRASVHPDEIRRYVAYNEKHGARYLTEEQQAAIEEEDW